MKIAALMMMLTSFVVGQSVLADTEKDFMHLTALIKRVADDNKSLNFSDLPIKPAFASTFFKAFKNVAITNIKISSQAKDILVFQATVTVAAQTMVVEFTIMGDRYARISDRALITSGSVERAEKILTQLPSDDFLNQSPVLPLNKLHDQNDIHDLVGDFVEPTLLTLANVQTRNKEAEEIIKSYFTTQKRLSAVSTTIHNLSARDKEALSALDFSIALVAPVLNLAEFVKKVDYRLAASLDILDVKDAIFIYSTRRYVHPNFKREIETGLNLTALIKAKHIKHEPLASTLKAINKYTKIADFDTLIINGVVTPEIVGSTLIIDLPGQIKIGKKIESKGIRLRAQIGNERNRIMLSVISKYVLKVRDQERIEVLGSLNFTPPSVVTLAGEMLGTWSNPFGIPALNLEDVALEVGTDFELVAASDGAIPITDIGGRARMKFPAGRLEFALFLSLTEQERLLIYGDFDGTLSLKDITRLSLKMHAQEQKLATSKTALLESKILHHIPDLALREARVFVSPVHQIVANHEYHKGLSIKAYIDVWDDHILFESKVSPKGIHALAYMPEFSIGPLRIRGSHFLSDASNIYQLSSVSKLNATSGPIIYLDINPAQEKSDFFIDGAVEADILGGIYADARIHLKKGGARLQITEKIGNVFESTMDFSTLSHTDSSDLELNGSFSRNALQLLTHKIHERAQSIKSDVLAKMLSNAENLFDVKKVSFKADMDGMEKNDLVVDIHFSLAKNKFELDDLKLDFDDVKGTVNRIYREMLDRVVNLRR